jgi:hypothetical protein
MTQPKRLSDKQIFRYWVEIRDLATGSVRKLPLTAVRLVCLKTARKSEPRPPDRELLRLEDDGQIAEAEAFDDLRAQLRDKYPDAAFERTLYFVRDHEAEERYEQGLNGLISILAKAAVDDLLAEQAHAQADSRRKRS